MHFKFAVRKSSTIGAVAARPANGDLAMAAFIMVCCDICNDNAARHSVSAPKVTAAGQLLIMVTKTSRYIKGRMQRMGVFSHLHIHVIRKTQGVASHREKKKL